MISDNTRDWESTKGLQFGPKKTAIVCTIIAPIVAALESEKTVWVRVST